MTSAKTTRQRLQELGEQDFFKHAIVKESGGLGDNFAELVNAHENLGRESLDTGLMLSVNAHLWGVVFPILKHGSERQKKLLPNLLAGRLLGGHAITEPQAGSDIGGLCTAAVMDGNEYVLNGRKRYISNAPIADVLVVYARYNQSLSAFIVRAGDPGLTIEPEPVVAACQNSPMGDVVLTNCRIPSDRILGKTGAGNMLIQQALELERAFIFAGILGIMGWQLDVVVHHSKTRLSGGMHLGAHQAISHKIADMKLRLDTVRLWLDRCVDLAGSKRRLTLASAQTKLLASEAFLQSSLDAVHILGSAGLEPDRKLLQLVADAQASRLFSGSSEIQKNIISGLLGTGTGLRTLARKNSE